MTFFSHFPEHFYLASHIFFLNDLFGHLHQNLYKLSKLLLLFTVSVSRKLTQLILSHAQKKNYEKLVYIMVLSVL